MFDIGFSELLVIAVVALIVLGPERLPKAARFAGLWVRRARAQWYSVKSELERELAAEELKRSLHDAKTAATDLHKSLQDTEAEVQAKVRAAEAEARREIEVMRRQATDGLVPAAAPAPEDATASTADEAAPLPAAATPSRDGAGANEPAPRQRDLLDAGKDEDDGRER